MIAVVIERTILDVFLAALEHGGLEFIMAKHCDEVHVYVIFKYEKPHDLFELGLMFGKCITTSNPN